MKKRKLFPLALLATFSVALWSCEPVANDDYCDIFEVIETIHPQCEVPSVCCPDDGTDCYILALNGDKYMCDKTTAEGTDTNGCNDATDDYIDAKCTTKVTAEQRAQIIQHMNSFTVMLMSRVRENSLCF